MKNPRAIIFAIVVGLLAVAAMYYYISQKENFYSDKFEQIPVLVAKQDIQRYEQIDETKLGIKLVPKPFKEPDAKTRNELEQVLGYFADSTIREGAQITDTKITSPGESRISILVPKDKRACAIAVNEISGVAGLIRPGDHVDIIGTFKTVDEKTRVAKQADAVTIFQNIPILAVGRNYMVKGGLGPSQGNSIIPTPSRSNSGFSNVTVSVSARQCMDLAVAQQVGQITLSLRSFVNRFAGDTFKSLKEKHSTAASVSGIEAPLEISRTPKWLEMRGERSILAP